MKVQREVGREENIIEVQTMQRGEEITLKGTIRRRQCNGFPKDVP